jgi:hypothetical protein
MATTLREMKDVDPLVTPGTMLEMTAFICGVTEGEFDLLGAIEPR